MGRSEQALPPLIGSGNVYGSYVHGIFDAPGIADAVLTAVCRMRGLDPAALGAFDVQKDIRFYDDVPQTYYEVTPGQFTLLFPEDAHAPMVGEGTIRKVIVKVRV